MAHTTSGFGWGSGLAGSSLQMRSMSMKVLGVVMCLQREGGGRWKIMDGWMDGWRAQRELS
jgi:hypothetical protein